MQNLTLVILTPRMNLTIEPVHQLTRQVSVKAELAALPCIKISIFKLSICSIV